MNFLKNIGSKSIALILLLIVFISSAVAQADQKVDMAYTMRSNGKIYVVVTVLSIILIGLFLYLIRLDRKISKLEKEN